MDFSTKYEFTKLTNTKETRQKVHITLTFLIIFCAAVPVIYGISLVLYSSGN